MAKQLNVDVNLNTAQAEAKLKNLQNLLSQAITSSSKSSAGGLTQEIVQATKAASELKVMLGQAMNPNTGNLDLSRFSQQLSKSKTSLNDYAKSLTKLGPQGQQAFMSLSKSIVSAEVPMRDTSKMLNEFGTTLKNTMRWQATSSLIHNLVGGIQNAMSYARGLNSSLNSIRIVTGASADEMNKFAKSANESAKALSASTLDYTDAALIYYQQGIRDQKQIKERTDATIKMANVTGDSAAKVSNQLTSIWNNFAKGGDNLEYYADVITALGAATASSSAEISAGLEKFASIAEETGLSYEYATSSLATIVATTRQSADVVGTALKTIFGRVQSLNLGETLEDGTTLGKYSKALSQVGIDIKDQNGQLKDMDMIIDEMGNKWQTLNRDQRVALAQAVAGARQYNQLMALMENYDFFKENVAIAKGSEGELTKQADIYAESWDAAKTRVRAAAQGIFDDLISDKFFIGFNDGLATALSGIDRFVDALGGIPGTLGLIGSIVTKVFSSQIGQSIERGIQSFKVFTGVARVEANSVREQAITAAKTFTPDETAPKSLQMQSNSLQQQLVLANQYQQKMEAIAKAGGQVAASDKQRIASLMQIVELTQEAAIAAQQQVEASEQAWSQTNADISRNMLAKGQSRKQVDKILNSLGEDKQLLENSRLATSAIDRFDKNNFNITQSQREGLTGILNQALLNNRSGLSQSKALDKDNINRENFITQYSQAIKKQEAALKLLASGGEYETIKKQYEQAQKKAKSYKGGDKSQAAALEAEANRFAEKLKQITNTIKDAVGNAAKSLGEEAEEAIIGKLKDETDKTRNDYINNILNNADTKVNAEDLENQGNAYLDETAEAIENLNKENFSGLTTGLTNAMSGVSNLAMGISSLQSGIQALNDESLSFGDKLLQVGMSFGMAVPMITSGIGSMATGLKGLKTHGAGLLSSAFLANTAAGFGESNAYRAALLAGTSDAFLMGEGSKGRLGKAISGKREQRYFDKILKQQFKAGATRQEAIGAASLAYKNKYGKYISSEAAAARATAVQSTGAAAGAQGAAAGGLSMLQVAGIVAALAALAVIIAKIKKEIHEASLEGQLEKAVEEGNSLSSALDEAKSSAEGLKSAFDSYHGIADSLSKCTTGTQEWTEALRANNNEVISLMSQYPELAKIQGAIQKNADGSLSISKEAEEQMNKMAQDRVDTLSWAKLANTELQQSLQDQMDLKTRSREMLNMQRAGQDTGHYEQGMEYKKDIKTSDFDTDMIGGFSYIHGNDSTGADAYERKQTRESQGPGQLTEVSANQKANELLLENWGELQALSGESLTQALGKVMTEGGLKITSDDLAKYSAGVESAAYRAEMTKMYNQQKAQQDAFETQQIGLINNKLASEGILENDSKTRDLISTLFGKQLDERTKEAVAEDKEAYNRGGQERIDLAEEYVRAMGGDTNSISWNGNEFSYLDSAGQKIEGITGAMVASVTGAASALDALAGSAEAAASAMSSISQTEAGDAVRDFIKNGDLTQTSTKGLKDIFGLQLEGNAFSAEKLKENLIKAAGGEENVVELAKAMRLDSGEFLTQLGEAALEEKQWYNSQQRKASMADIHASTGADQERLENYSRAELEARQKYEDSKTDRGPVKTLQELETAAAAAGEAQEYLNRTWKDGTHLTSDQMSGLKGIISDAQQYALVIDESTGKVKDASLLYDMLNKTVSDVGIEATRAQMPIYEQLNSLYDDLASNSTNYSEERQAGILQEIELLEQEISKYKQLAIAQSGAAQAYDKIAEGKEWDEAHDYTDELNSAVGSIYSHMEQDDNGNWKWSTLEKGSHEVQAALDALLPKNVREGTSPDWMDAQQYIEFMYGNNKKDGRYRSKSGDITKQNVENFIKDASGEAPYGDFTGFARDIDLAEGKMTLLTDKMGEFQNQISLKDAAESMHMTEASFLSMITAMDKYNESGKSFLDYFNLEGAEFATQLEANAQNIKTAAEEVQAAFQDTSAGAGERQQAALDKQTQALQEQAKLRRQAIDDAFEYKSLQAEQNDLINKSIEGSLTADEEARLGEIQQRIAELESEDIEIKVTFATDENAIESIKQTLQSSSANELEDISQTNLNSIMQKVAAAEDSAKVLSETGLDKMIGDMDKLSEGMKTKVTNALAAAGKDSAWLKGITDSIKEATEGEENQPEVEPTVKTDNWDKFKSEVEEWASEPLEKEVKYTDNKDSLEDLDKKNKKDSTTGDSSGRKQSQQQQQNQTQAPEPVKVTADISDVQAKLETVNSLISSISSPPPLTISSNLTNVADQAATLSGVLHTLAGAVPVITIDTNANEVGGKIQQLKTKALQLNGIKPRISISSNASAVLGTVASLKTALSTLPSTKVINISVNVSGKVPNIPAFGTAQAYGNARAYGNVHGQWGTGTGPFPTLVGELGQELVVDPSTGKFYTVGDAGAELTVLPKNAIVFNHKQTEQLLKYRKINSRGQAMAEGNANQTAVTTEGFDINGLIKNAGTVVVVNNYTGTNPNAKKDSASSSGSDSTSAGTDERIQWEEKLITVIRDEVDVYKEINKQLDRLEHQVNWFERNLDRLFGIHLMDQYAKTIEKLNVLYQRQVKAVDEYKEISNVDKESLSHLLIQWEEKVEDKDSKAGGRKYNTNRASQIQDAFEMMMTYGGLSADAFTRNANGVVEDWDRVATQVALAKMKQNAEITWNSRVHDESLTEVQRTQYENEYNYIIQMVEQITAALGHAEDSMDKIEDAAETAQDTLEKMHDLSAQQLKTQLQIHIDLMDNQKKLLDFALKRIPDVMGHQMDRYLKLFDGSLKSGTDAFDISINKLKEYEEFSNEADRRLQLGRDSNGQDPDAINEKDWAEMKQQAFDGIMDSLNALIETRDELAEAYDHTAKVGIDEIEKLTTQMEHSVSVLDHLQNLLELTGRKFDFEAKETIIQGSKHNLKNTLDEAIYWSDLMTENRAEAEKQYQELLETDAAGAEWYKRNVLDKAVEMEIEADEKKYKAAEEYAQKVEELWKNTMEKVAYNWEKAATKGEGWDYLTKSMERAKAIQEEYLTTTNKLYETNTLLNKLSKDMNKTDSQASKEKIASFQKEVENAQLSTKLAKSQMDILKARYEILQAEMALEDAKNAKSTVRLQRDNEGNYGYVYTADQDKVDDAEQNLLDKQNDLYNLVLNIQNETQEKIIQSRREFQDQYNQIWQDYYDGRIATVEERENKIAELKQQYSELWEAYDIDLTESDYWLNQVAADGVSEAWAHSYQDRISTQDEFMAECADAADELTAIMDEVNEARKYLTEEAKLGLEDVKKKTEEVTKKNDELAKQLHITETAVDAELDAIRNLTAEFAAQYSELEALIDQYYALAEAINAALMAEAGMQQEGRPDYSLLIADAYGRGDMAEVERLTGIREQVIDIEGLTQDQYGMRTAGLNKVMDVGVSAGYTGEELSKWGIDAYQGLYRLGIDVSDDKFSQDAVTKIMGRYIMEGEEAAVDEFKKIQGLDTGGYTGEWGSNGKLAILHEKELVLNPNDTSNLLEALKIAKENYMQSIQTQRLQSLYEQQMIASTEQLTSAAFQNNTGSLQQDVTIHAEFPNVTERNEIAEAFKTLVNEASQFANRY